ncbi:hypothetical protein [Pseudomonas sp. dw_612]|uniref:hypothetical protein n=1 Tax=Pseudomonas sp. dw_612 TaxID=2720080 RepID=UPI001BD6A320|nr:hypothetical protein [Pseudomonas sp. dw_612]
MTDNIKAIEIEPKLKCGLIMPISAIDGCPASHWIEVALLVKESLIGTSFTTELVSDADEIGVIQKRIVQNIYNNEMVICDVSAKNPNVMFELGMRLAFDKPTIIIKDDKTNYSFDTSVIEHIEYPRDLHYPSIVAFKAKLKEKVLKTYTASKESGFTTFLGHFGQFVVSKIDVKTVGKEEFLTSAIEELRNSMTDIKIMLTKSAPRKINPPPELVRIFTKKYLSSEKSPHNTAGEMDIERLVMQALNACADELKIELSPSNYDNIKTLVTSTVLEHLL